MKDKLIEKLKELIENFLDKPDDPPLIWFRQKDKLLFEIAALEKQIEEQESISDKEIKDFIQSHPGNLGNLIMDKAVDAGFLEGAKMMRDHPEQLKTI